MSSKQWFPLESNPEVMNKYMKSLGVEGTNVQFCDVFGMDEELLQMVRARTTHATPPLLHSTLPCTHTHTRTHAGPAAVPVRTLPVPAHDQQHGVERQAGGGAAGGGYDG